VFIQSIEGRALEQSGWLSNIYLLVSVRNFIAKMRLANRFSQGGFFGRC